MRAFLIVTSTAATLGALLASIYFVPVGWALLAALVVMGTMIVLDQKSLALGVVLGIFLFGMVLPFKHNTYHLSRHLSVKGNTVVDLDTNRTYRIESDLFEKAISETNASRWLACQHATLFGRPLADRFCYLVVGDSIYALKAGK